MPSLIHIQLSAPRFPPLIVYAWKRSSFSDESAHFEHVLEVCFPKEIKTAVFKLVKNSIDLLQCSNCRSDIGFGHFFVQYHMHPIWILQFFKVNDKKYFVCFIEIENYFKFDTNFYEYYYCTGTLYYKYLLGFSHLVRRTVGTVVYDDSRCVEAL